MNQKIQNKKNNNVKIKKLKKIQEIIENSNPKIIQTNYKNLIIIQIQKMISKYINQKIIKLQIKKKNK